MPSRTIAPVEYSARQLVRAVSRYNTVDTLDELIQKKDDQLEVVAPPKLTSYNHTILFVKDAAGLLHAYATKPCDPPTTT